MRYFHGIDRHVADTDACICKKLVKRGIYHLAFFIALNDTVYRSCGSVYRNVMFFKNGVKCRYMIHVLMCHEDRIEIVKRKIESLKAFFYSLFTGPGINQYMCVVGAYVGTIAATAAGNTGTTHINKNLLLPIYFYLIALMNGLHIIGSRTVKRCYNASSVGFGKIKIYGIEDIYKDIISLSVKSHCIIIYKYM